MQRENLFIRHPGGRKENSQVDGINTLPRSWSLHLHPLWCSSPWFLWSSCSSIEIIESSERHLQVFVCWSSSVALWPMWPRICGLCTLQMLHVSSKYGHWPLGLLCSTGMSSFQSISYIYDSCIFVFLLQILIYKKLENLQGMFIWPADISFKMTIFAFPVDFRNGR